MNRFNDIVSLGMKRVFDGNGFASVPAVITRVGVQQYTKDQLGIVGVSGSELVNVYRGPETVFHADTIDTFKHMPITDGHPPEGVSPLNAKLVQGGHITENVSKLNDIELGATLFLTDQAFIDGSKGSQTSAGYDATIVAKQGVDPVSGQKFDYAFDGPMIGNHLALVDRARCGASCRVLDEDKTKETKMADELTKADVAAMIADNNEKLKVQTGTIVTDALTAHQTKLDATAEAKRKEDEDSDQQKLDDEAAAEKLKADATASAELRVKVKPLLGDKFDDSKSDQELLVLCFADRVDDAENKSVDYLSAMLDSELKDRETGNLKIQDSAVGTSGVTVRAIV